MQNLLADLPRRQRCGEEGEEESRSEQREHEVKQQVGGRSSQGGRPQLADMDGRPFLDGAVPLPEPQPTRVGRPSVYSQALAERP